MARSLRKHQFRPQFVPTWKPKQRPLLTLLDQGKPLPIAPGLFGIAGRDQSWNTHAENFISANRPQFSALEVMPEFSPQSNEIGLRLRPGGVVGAVPLRAPDTRKISGGVVVRPRFGWDGIGPLLQAIGWTASPNVLEMPLVPGSAREIPPWVLAGPILQRLAQLLWEVRKGFCMHEEVRQSPRGQILWNRYVCDQMSRGAYQGLPCRFPELGPDELLRCYLRWGVEKVHRSLLPYSVVDMIARRLAEQAKEMLDGLSDCVPRPPDSRVLEQVSRRVGLSSAVFRRGLQALSWVVEERGLAGESELDGLAWALPMHQLFERWVEHVARSWAREFGGLLLSGRAEETVIPIAWDRGSKGGLKSLIPDFVVKHEDHVYIIEAKYKRHFQDFDDRRWFDLVQEIRDEHRRDIHQVLAYAAFFGESNITAVLVYPMHPRTWLRLAQNGRTISRAALRGGGRRLDLALAGLPIQLPPDQSMESIIRSWDAIRGGQGEFGSS